MAKSHVKKNPSVTLVLKPIPVKTLFFNLQKVKENNKKEVSTTSDKVMTRGKYLLEDLGEPLRQMLLNNKVSVKLYFPVPVGFWMRWDAEVKTANPWYPCQNRGSGRCIFDVDFVISTILIPITKELHLYQEIN